MSDTEVSFSTTEAYYITNLVLYALFIKPLFILWVISLCIARRKSDPARVGFSWMKAVYPFWILYVILVLLFRLLASHLLFSRQAV